MEYLKTIRKQKGISAEDLASRCGVSASQIWSYESGRRLPPLDVLCKIADELDVSLDLLVRGKEKDRSVERSPEALLKAYRDMPEEQLSFFIALMQAALADRRFQAHLHQDGQE